jgi:uncharacterized membrane protein YphA (DoxX/SURF4 family)
MMPSVAIIALRLFLRLLLGLILFSVGTSKLVHLTQFRRGIQDYQLIPPDLDSRLALTRLLSYGFPVAEIVAGLALISGIFLLPATALAIFLMIVFSAAITINLVRGRADLSCHCGGAIGDHRISWWLVGRNGLLILSFLFLLVTPSDLFTVATLARSPSTVSTILWMNVVLPTILLVVLVLVVLMLFNAVRTLFRS